jgi:methyl-accepting chemotaxis protein
MERSAWSGGSECRAGEQNPRLILIIVAALLTAGIIVLAWLVLRHMLLKPLSASIAQLENVAAGDLTHTLNAPRARSLTASTR